MSTEMSSEGKEAFKEEKLRKEICRLLLMVLRGEGFSTIIHLITLSVCVKVHKFGSSSTLQESAIT
ncbi:hypothetical protein COLO4_09568 [Corchorus olitorius]|uniref:Uncharacterized protein n=1 Tax=Corchorus olitorius TaxID=93759 RepID=A0A1R3KBS8_9ROSI|nr:hypothetical protein COLO4_09568 [Corchorus olitorius]